MKIDPSLLTQTGLEPDSIASRKLRQSGDSKNSLQTGSDIQIKLSPTLHGIEQTLAATDIHTSRIEAIKQALASGQYQISSERIASSLITSTLQTLSEGE